jgi:hypothetical protein
VEAAAAAAAAGITELYAAMEEAWAKTCYICAGTGKGKSCVQECSYAMNVKFRFALPRLLVHIFDILMLLRRSLAFRL